MVGLAACVPTRFHVEPYRSDGVQAAVLQAHAAAYCRAQRDGAQLPDHPFTSDGCSLWPDDGWVACCIEHDIRYWCGGSCAERAAADHDLEACVARARGRLASASMWSGVRLGGTAWSPFTWRWAYGFDGIHGYDPPREP